MNRLRAVVLASGGGSNLQALLDHLARLGDRRALNVVLVASDRPSAGALERARRADVDTAIIATPRNPLPASLDAVLSDARAEVVVLAGYLRLIPEPVTRAFAGRMLNVHPGPLPEFGGAGMFGARVHRAVLQAGAAWSGPTVHLVDEIYDHGAVLAHWPVPVLPNDDEALLAARVLRAEHLLFPRVVQSVARALRVGQRPPAVHDLPPFDPALDDATLGSRLDTILPAE